MAIERPFWYSKIVKSWEKAPIVWLQGLRRLGKTTLAKSFPNSVYFNCDLPSTQEDVHNPEAFLKEFRKKILILDEIHQLPEASLILKIAADEYPSIKVLATGSSTLVASKKFKDTLSGRKRSIHFLPVLVEELNLFKVDLNNRLLRGGLPPPLLASEIDLDFYGEWLDSFYARDIQELFAIEKRQPFLKALEYILSENGKLFEATKLAQVSGVSRPTIIKYLDALELTKAITILRPFTKNSEQEIVSQPKIYGFDTGFCCYVQGIRSLTTKDIGTLLENLTLETFQANGLGAQLKYWRTKSKQEIDFVLPLKRDFVLAVECKWKEKNFDPSTIISFRARYPQGENWTVTSDSISRTEKIKGISFKFINIYDLHKEISSLV
jgi:predicted AAA+ superfamily ATPase